MATSDWFGRKSDSTARNSHGQDEPSDDTRAAFSPGHELGDQASRLLQDLADIRSEVGDRTFAESETEERRLAGARLLISISHSFLVH
jgi:hypothetical protein